MTAQLRKMEIPGRIDVLGVHVHALNVRSAKDVFLAALKRHRKGYVCFTSVHSVTEAKSDPELLQIYENAMIVAPDGMPLVWVGHLQGFKDLERVAGPEMMLEVIGGEEFRGYSHFLCGGEPGMAEELRGKLLQRFPGVNICGVFTPPFRPMKVDEERALIEAVHRVKPDIIWVGLGAPKQERFMARYLPLLDTTLMMGVGAAFLFHTGRICDSPAWVKRAGLQWAHRLIQEPGRLWKRYLVSNSAFVFQIALQLLFGYRANRAGVAERPAFEKIPRAM